MGKRGEQAGLEKFKRALTEIGDVLRRAAQNPDELDLKPEVKAWLTRLRTYKRKCLSTSM